MRSLLLLLLPPLWSCTALCGCAEDPATNGEPEALGEEPAAPRATNPESNDALAPAASNPPAPAAMPDPAPMPNPPSPSATTETPTPSMPSSAPAAGGGGTASMPGAAGGAATSMAGSGAGGEASEGGSAGSVNAGGGVDSGGAGGTAPAVGGGGTGGSSAGSSAGGEATGGSGGAAVVPDGVAVAQIATTGVDGTHDDVTGTATFTQVGEEVTLLLELEGCPMGPHISHIHVNASCEDEGNGAGNHWLPNGELITDYACDAEGNVSYTLVIDGGRWTIGSSDDETDVDGHSIVVHNGTSVAPGDRVACGVIELQE